MQYRQKGTANPRSDLGLLRCNHADRPATPPQCRQWPRNATPRIGRPAPKTMGSEFIMHARPVLLLQALKIATLAARPLFSAVPERKKGPRTSRLHTTALLPCGCAPTARRQVPPPHQEKVILKTKWGADLFWNPFFSSLSSCVGTRHTKPEKQRLDDEKKESRRQPR